MNRIVAFLIAFLAGCLTVVQTAINTELSKQAVGGASSPLPALLAALVNFTVGLAVVLSVAFIHKPNMSDMHCCRLPEGDPALSPDLPPWRQKLNKYRTYLGGPCGAVYVTCSVVFSKRIGVALYFVLATAGTMSASLLLDGRGLLGLKKQQITRQKMAALALLIGGVIMVQDPGNTEETEHEGGVAEKVTVSVLAYFAGWMNPTQAALNRSMQDILGSPFRAAVISFIGGVSFLTVACTGAALIAGEEAKVYYDVDWYVWTGGFLGVCYVSSAILAVRVVGAAAYYCVMVGSQLTVAFLFDSLGLMGYEKKEVSPLRIAGTIVSMVAVVLYTWPIGAEKKPEKAPVEAEVAPEESQVAYTRFEDGGGVDSSRLALLGGVDNQGSYQANPLELRDGSPDDACLL